MNTESQSRKAQTQALFNVLAPTYDTTGPACFAHFGRELVELVGLDAGQRVLDVATGRGAVLFPAVERTGESGEVVGIDLAETMISETAAEIDRRGSSARVLPMDAEQLDFADASFDRVLCGFGVMFFPSQSQALAEFRRVLRPGGRIGLSTWKTTQVDDLGAVLHSMGLSSGMAPGWITEAERLSELLESARFEGVHVQEASNVFVYADLDQYWHTAMTTGLRRDLAKLNEPDASRVRESLAERLNDRQHADGLHIEATALLAVGDRP